MIITIGRQHGSGGHDIARLLAKELNINCYGKEIVDEAASRSNLCREVVDSFDEKRVAAFVAGEPHLFGLQGVFGLNMQAATAQFDAIRSLAEKGDAVFAGRCADYVLRERDDLLRVFILSDLPQRIRTVMARYDLGEDQAKKLVREVDKDRASFYRYYTDQIWGEAQNYDLCINSGKIGVEGSVKVIMGCLKARGMI
jgi:cytidylate kinase